MKKLSLLCVLIFNFSQISSAASVALAADIANDQLYTGDTVEKIDTQVLADSIPPGSIVVLGEHHQLGPHQDKQIEFMEKLLNGDHLVSVGMEFLTYPHQPAVDAYVNGELNEDEFLRQAEWGDNDFSYYRRQILFSRQSGGKTIALNAPRWLTAKVAKSGLSSLSEEEKSFLPPNFTVGNDAYFERFWQAVGGHHVPREKARDYFTAHSIWDDTMAWKAVAYIDEHPDTVLVIVVGDFHVEYGGGLPDRLQARGAANVVTISQINLAEFSTSEEAWRALRPHPRWGQRADYIWTSTKEVPADFAR